MAALAQRSEVGSLILEIGPLQARDYMIDYSRQITQIIRAQLTDRRLGNHPLRESPPAAAVVESLTFKASLACGGTLRLLASIYQRAADLRIKRLHHTSPRDCPIQQTETLGAVPRGSHDRTVEGEAGLPPRSFDRHGESPDIQQRRIRHTIEQPATRSDPPSSTAISSALPSATDRLAQRST